MASLPDDLLVEILSRLHVKSVFRCKAVSRHRHFLISHGNHRRKFSHILPGLFYRSTNYGRFPKEARHFTHVWEGRQHPLVCPSLSFLPGYERMTIVDSCNGMLLCRFSEIELHDAWRYVVCNPVEKRMIVLPDSGCGADVRVARLAFDPAFYPRIYVFEFVNNDNDKVVGAHIYSTQTGAWSYKEGGWGPHAYCIYCASCVFYNGFLHLVTNKFEVFAVDVEGETWCSIPLPDCFF